MTCCTEKNTGAAKPQLEINREQNNVSCVRKPQRVMLPRRQAEGQ
jgi:hypothetical protein